MNIVNTKFELFPAEQLKWFTKAAGGYSRAIAEQQTTPGALMLSQELTTKGHRKFGVLYNPTELPVPCKNSNIYEVIQPGHARLFLDIEWYYSGEEYDEKFPEDDTAYATLLDAITKALGEQGVTNFEHTVLNASDKKKYSRHAMFDSVWFKNTHEHMRNFIDDLCATWADSDNYVLQKASLA